MMRRLNLQPRTLRTRVTTQNTLWQVESGRLTGGRRIDSGQPCIARITPTHEQVKTEQTKLPANHQPW